MNTSRPTCVDEYLAGVTPEEARTSLSKLRAIIQSEIPEAEEVISYGMPGYKFNGYLVGFAAFKNHCSFFPGAIVADFADELSGYKTSKGTIQFSRDQPLPETLVRTLLKARIADNLAKKKHSNKDSHSKR